MLNKLTILALAILFSQLASASESLLWVGYNQNTTDFFNDGKGQIKPDGIIVGLSTEILDSLAVTVSYGDFKGGTSRTAFENDQISLLESGKVETQSYGLSLSWLGDDYGLTLSYGQLDNNESSISRLPLIREEVDGDDQVLSFSYDKFISKESWGFGWSLGSQYAQSEVALRDLIGSEPVTQIAAQFDSESWSAFADLDLSYDFQVDDLVISPKLTLSWSWQLANNGNEILTVSRDGRRMTFTQLNDRLATTFRTPDSGFWEFGIDFEWSNGWGASLAYGQSIAAESDVDSISFDVSVAF